MTYKKVEKGDEKIDINPGNFPLESVTISTEIVNERMLTTISLPPEMKDELSERKIIEREPYYHVLRRLLDATKRKPRNKA